MTMTNLTVCDRDGVLVVDSRLIADDLGIQHKNLLETVEKHYDTIEEHFGAVSFETREFKTSQGNMTGERVAYLTEDQASFVGTLSRNTDRAVSFKAHLVKAFSAAKSSALKAMTPGEMMVMQAQRFLDFERRQTAVEQQQAEMQFEQAKLKETILEHDAEIGRIFEPDGMLITLAGCLNLNGVHATAAQLASVGKAASKIYKAKYGKKPEKIGDARYGEVNAYPRAIAEQVLRDHGYID